MRSRKTVNMPFLALKDFCGCGNKLFNTCKMQARTDAAMSGILEANAIQVLGEAPEKMLSGEEEVLNFDGTFCDCRCHVTKEGFVSAKSAGCGFSSFAAKSKQFPPTNETR